MQAATAVQNEPGAISHQYWRQGDCYVCGSAFCVQRIPLRIRHKLSGTIMGGYVCSLCGQEYVRRGSTLKVVKAELNS